MTTPVLRCEECGYFSRSAFFMETHMKRHELPQFLFDCEKSELEEFSCEKCQFTSPLATNFSQHYQESKCQIQINPTKVNEDTNAIPTLLYKSNVIRQYRRIYGNTHKCKKCCYFSKSVFSILNHVRLHQMQRRPFRCETSSLEEFFCEDCQFSTNFFITFKEHVRKVHSKQDRSIKLESFKCQHCDFTTIRKKSLTRHLICKHIPPECIKWHQCEHCEYKAKEAGTLRKHVMHKHTPDQAEIKWHQCKECGYETKRLYSLKLHVINIHTPIDKVKWHHCDQCGKKFRSKRYLRCHIRYKHLSVPDTKLYPCDQCEYQGKLGNLKAHKRLVHRPIHEIKWHQCEHCDFKSKRPFNVKKHIKVIHLGARTEEVYIKWHHCQQCDYKSKKTGDLYRHIRCKHTPVDEINWYQCHLCDYKGKRPSNLKEHIKYKHTPSHEIEWRCCEYCDYKTQFTSTLNRHRRRKHCV